MCRLSPVTAAQPCVAWGSTGKGCGAALRCLQGGDGSGAAAVDDAEQAARIKLAVEFLKEAGAAAGWTSGLTELWAKC